MNVQADVFLSALRKLPPTPSVVWHGTMTRVGPGSVALRTPVASSLDVRVATENFDSPSVAAIASRTGRLIAPLSAYPSEREIVLVPGAILVRVGSFEHLEAGLTVELFEELATNPAETVSRVLPRTPEEFEKIARETISQAWGGEAVTISSPGKYVTPFAVSLA